jgi:uncharacterized Zn-binding protein involved in type VI secretion
MLLLQLLILQAARRLALLQLVLQALQVNVLLTLHVRAHCIQLDMQLLHLLARAEWLQPVVPACCLLVPVLLQLVPVSTAATTTTTTTTAAATATATATTTAQPQLQGRLIESGHSHARVDLKQATLQTVITVHANQALLCQHMCSHVRT